MQSVSEVTPYCNPNASVLQAYITEAEDLRKLVAELQSQLSKKKEQRKKKHDSNGDETQDRPSAKAKTDLQAHQAAPKPQPKAWFCFRCGDNGHIARLCENPPSKPFVDQKYKELKARQDEWKAKYGNLNWTGSQ